MDQSTTVIVVETVCCFMINLQCLINIMFVRRQWLTTRKQLYRQAITTTDKERYRKQIKLHRLLFMLLEVGFVLFLGVTCLAYYKINEKSYKDDPCFEKGLVDCKGA